MSKKDDLLERYEAWLKRSRSPRTIYYYLGRARNFLDWAGRRKVNGKTLDDYITHLAESGKKTNTVATYYQSLRSFFSFLGLDDELEKVRPPRFVEVEIRCPTKEDIDMMIGAAQTRMESALVTLQFGSGLRVGELRSLKVKDLKILEDGTGELTVRSLKTRGKIEIVKIPLAAGTVREVSAYINTLDGGSDDMFPSKLVEGKPITNETINHIYERLCKRAGIETISSHQIRHAYTTWLLKQGVPKDDVRRILRWNSDAPMKRYDHLVPTDIRERIPDPFQGGEEEEDDDDEEP